MPYLFVACSSLSQQELHRADGNLWLDFLPCNHLVNDVSRGNGWLQPLHFQTPISLLFMHSLHFPPSCVFFLISFHSPGVKAACNFHSVHAMRCRLSKHPSQTRVCVDCTPHCISKTILDTSIASKYCIQMAVPLFSFAYAQETIASMFLPSPL